MPIIVANVSNKRRIETGVPKLSIWDPPKQIYSMNERNMVLKNDSNMVLYITNCTIPPLMMMMMALEREEYHLQWVEVPMFDASGI